MLLPRHPKLRLHWQCPRPSRRPGLHFKPRLFPPSKPNFVALVPRTSRLLSRASSSQPANVTVKHHVRSRIQGLAPRHEPRRAHWIHRRLYLEPSWRSSGSGERSASFPGLKHVGNGCDPRDVDGRGAASVASFSYAMSTDCYVAGQ